MNARNHGLRKAAILVASLDTRAADALLDQFSPDEAQQVRDLLMEMGEVDRHEQQRVIDEFFRVGPPAPVRDPSGIELDGPLARRLAERGGTFVADELSLGQGLDQADEKRPFEFLGEAQADKLARILAEERPQTMALVLSHLPPRRASGVLVRLPSATQTEVIRRLVDLEETDPEVLRAVEEGLQSRLAEHVQVERRRVAGIQAVAGILEAADRHEGLQILDNLAAEDRSLAERLGPRPMEFDDLERLSGDILIEVFRAAGDELAVPALLGASPELVQRVLGLLPSDDAELLREQLDHPGPIRLRDVEEARRQVAKVAQRVAYQAKREVVGAGHW
jgi:flagellar motor switch protein FliG